MNAFEDGQRQIVERGDIAWGVVFPVRCAILAQRHILVPVQIIFDAPMLAVVSQNGLRQSLVFRQADDKPRCLKRRFLPHAILFDLP